MKTSLSSPDLSDPSHVYSTTAQYELDEPPIESGQIEKL